MLSLAPHRWVLAVGEDDAVVIFEHRGMGYAQTRRILMWRPPEEIVMQQESTALYVLAGGKCALVSEALDEGEAKVSVLCDAAVGEGCLAQLSATEVLVAASDGHAMMVFSLPPPPLPTALNTTTSTTSTTSASPSHPLCFTL
jgi:hypothetical protein